MIRVIKDGNEIDEQSQTLARNVNSQSPTLNKLCYYKATYFVLTNFKRNLFKWNKTERNEEKKLQPITILLHVEWKI